MTFTCVGGSPCQPLCQTQTDILAVIAWEAGSTQDAAHVVAEPAVGYGFIAYINTRVFDLICYGGAQ